MRQATVTTKPWFSACKRHSERSLWQSPLRSDCDVRPAAASILFLADKNAHGAKLLLSCLFENVLWVISNGAGLRLDTRFSCEVQWRSDSHYQNRNSSRPVQEIDGLIGQNQMDAFHCWTTIVLHPFAFTYRNLTSVRHDQSSFLSMKGVVWHERV